MITECNRRGKILLLFFNFIYFTTYSIKLYVGTSAYGVLQEKTNFYSFNMNLLEKINFL